MDNNAKILTGFSLGLLTGAVAGLLYAPEKGDKTRKKLKKTATKTYDDSLKKVNELKTTVNKEIDDIAKQSKKTIDQLKSSVNYNN